MFEFQTLTSFDFPLLELFQSYCFNFEVCCGTIFNSILIYFEKRYGRIWSCKNPNILNERYVELLKYFANVLLGQWNGYVALPYRHFINRSKSVFNCIINEWPRKKHLIAGSNNVSTKIHSNVIYLLKDVTVFFSEMNAFTNVSIPYKKRTFCVIFFEIWCWSKVLKKAIRDDFVSHYYEAGNRTKVALQLWTRTKHP